MPFTSYAELNVAYLFAKSIVAANIQYLPRLHIGLDIMSFRPISRSLGDELAFGLARRNPLLLVQRIYGFWAHRRILLISLRGFASYVP